MNRTLLAAIVLATWGSAAIAQSSVAQKPLKFASAKPLNAVPLDKPAAAGTTRVAVINLAYVLSKYERASFLKEELQAEAKKAQEEAKRLMEQCNLLQQTLQKGDFKNNTKEQFEEKLINTRRRLEDLNRTASAKLGKATQAQLVILWKDVQEAVKTYSARHGIELVMTYADAPSPNDAASFQNLTRKLGATDNGGSTPIFMAPGVDISEAVTDLLNERFREAREKEELNESR
jgi:Skp family chaperone for outer membrane proteins